jgi:hypothetical protein
MEIYEVKNVAIRVATDAIKIKIAAVTVKLFWNLLLA